VDFGELLRQHIGRFEDYVFVDLGSGKGRAVMLASRLPFREVIGIEFSQKLHMTAMRNVGVWSRVEHGAPIKLVCGDVSECQFPRCPMVVFMYNPFGAEIMRELAKRMAAINERVLLVYFTPKHADIWDATPGFHRVQEIAGCIVWDKPPAETP
jgi:predicted RNA methylase